MPTGFKLEKIPSFDQAKERSWSLFIKTISSGVFLAVLSEVLDRINNSDFQEGIDTLKYIFILLVIPCLAIASLQGGKYYDLLDLTEEEYTDLFGNNSEITNKSLEKYLGTIRGTPLKEILNIFISVSDENLLDFSDLISGFLDWEYGGRIDLSLNNGMMIIYAKLDELVLQRSDASLDVVTELLKSFRQLCEENELDEEEFAWDVCQDFKKPEQKRSVT